MGSYCTLRLSKTKALELYCKIKNITPSDEEIENLLEEFCLNESLYNCSVYPDDVEYLQDWKVEFLVDSKLNQIKQETESTEPFTYASLIRRIDWDDLHTLIGVDYYCQSDRIEDSEIFNIKKSDIEKYNL